MELDFEPVEAVASLMRIYAKAKYELTGKVSHNKAFWHPTRSRWFGTFKRLYKELRAREIDPEEYILWALRKDKTEHHGPNQLVSPWKYDAFVKARKKAKVDAVHEGLDYTTLLGQAKSDMQVAVDRWQERKRFYADYRAFLLGEYMALPALFLATDTEFFEVCKSSTNLLADKLNKVMHWVNYLWKHKKLAKEIGVIRDSTLGLATAS